MIEPIDQVSQEILSHLGNEGPEVEGVGAFDPAHRRRMSDMLNVISHLEDALRSQVAYTNQLEDEITSLRNDLVRARMVGAA